jgi:hypothetical protein
MNPSERDGLPIMSEDHEGSVRKTKDASGYVRVALRFGRASPGFLRPPYAHFTSASGARVDRWGSPVRQAERANFAQIEWDLPAPSRPAPVAVPPTVAAAWPLVTRSPTFVRLFDGVRRAGFTIRVPRTDRVSCVIAGTPMIDIAEAPRGGFVARLVEQVATASAFGDGAGVPVLDPRAPDFARTNAGFLIERYGRAKLLAAVIRDEILVAGGADIGRPGLRGDQLEAYDRHRSGETTFEVAATELARSAHGNLGAPFDEVYGPPAGRHLHAAFMNRFPGGAPRKDPELAPLVALLGRLAAVDNPLREVAEPVLGVGFDVVDLSNPYWTVSRSGALAPALAIELHEPNDRSPRGRFVVYPEQPVTLGQLVAAFPGGVPFHVGARATDTRATMAFPIGARGLFAGFDVLTGAVDPLVVGPPVRWT